MDLGFLAAGVVGALPTVLVLTVGLALVAVRRQMLRRAAGLAFAGCAVLLAGTCATASWNAGLPYLIREDVITYGTVSPIGMGVGLFTTLAQAAGLGLLIAAVLARTSGPVPMAPQDVVR